MSNSKSLFSIFLHASLLRSTRLAVPTCPCCALYIDPQKDMLMLIMPETVVAISNVDPIACEIAAE